MAGSAQQKYIVLGWATKTKIVQTDNVVRRNGQYEHELVCDWQAHAAVWCTGSRADEQRARDYAQADTEKQIHVLTFKLDTPDPIEAAKAQVLKIIKKSQSYL